MREAVQIGLYILASVFLVVTVVLILYVVRDIRQTGFSKGDALAFAAIAVTALGIIVPIILAQTSTRTGTGPDTGQTTNESRGPDTPLIESVDYWYNTQYRTDCRDRAAQAFVVDVRKRTGLGPPDSEYSDGYTIYVQQVESGDLTGDGRPEAAVLL
jgi:hypothetical protein